MPFLNTERVLNENSEKRFIIAYNNLKEDYSDENLDIFMNEIRDKDLSFILSNSRYIFGESQRGLSFYRKIINTCCGFCSFTRMQSEYEKFCNFIDTNRDKMDTSILDLYNGTRADIEISMKNYGPSIDIANYIQNKLDSPFNEEVWSDALYQAYVMRDSTRLIELTKHINQVEIYLLYVPYSDLILAGTGANNIISSTIDWFNDALEDSDALKGIMCANILNKSYEYRKAVWTMSNRYSRFMIESFIEADNSNIISDIDTKVISMEDVSTYSTPIRLLNDIIIGSKEDLLYENTNAEERNRRNELKRELFEYVAGILEQEFTRVDDTSAPAIGYGIFNEGTSIEKAYVTVTEELESMNITPVDDDSYEMFENNDTEENTENITIDDNSSKKDEAPVKNNPRITQRVQNRAMDLEAKQNKLRAKVKERGQNTKNAIKAVTQLPKNFAEDIKNQFNKLDNADDERRRKFMQEPGFRKNGFKNLKLALLYGTAAQIKLTLIPITMICRHFSKEKDVRIRNELVRELDTEIAVCEEKIRDADGNGDKKEKYELMRIKDKLTSEKQRVLTNSKYI